MKIFTKKSFVHKIVLSLVILISVTAVVPNYSYSAAWEDAGGALLKEIIQLVASLGDAFMGAFNGIMLGTQGMGSAMVEQNDHNMDSGSGSWLVTPPENGEVTEYNIPSGYMDKVGLFDQGEYQIPNMLYCPENIFGNKIAALDINFLNPNEYKSAVSGNNVQYNENTPIEDQDKQISGAAVLGSTIATWYNSFRNIAIVGLLSVLVYLGIRILISTTANDKAKYKENLKDWLLALCLVFVMHFIMSGIIMITEKFTDLFTTSTNTIKVIVQDGPTFYTNLTGLVRFKAQAEAWQDAVTYTVIYVALIIYTIIFTFIYFKRFLYTAFFTMIAPLVALTYPIDKAGDKKAQAFNLWFKEYTMNVIIQPVHLLLYTALVTSAMDLVANNPIYALVAIGFLVPAEKFIKKMFGIESESTSGFGSFAGGAMAMKALDYLGSGGKKGSSKGGGKEDSLDDSKPRFQDNKQTGKLASFNNGNEEDKKPKEIENGEEDKSDYGSKVLDGYEPNSNEDDEYETLLRDRDEYQKILDGEDTDFREFDDDERALAQDEIDRINGEMYRKGYLGDENQNIEISEEDEKNPWANYNDEELFELRDNAQKRVDHSSTEESKALAQSQVDELNKELFNRERVDKHGNKIITGKKLGGGSRTIRGLSPMVGKMAWKAAKGTAKFAAKATGVAAGAAIGLAAGITTGDPSKAWQYMGAGALAGNAIANKATRAPSAIMNKAKNTERKIYDFNDEFVANADGYDAMRQEQVNRENKKAREATLRNQKEMRKYREMAGDIGIDTTSSREMNNFMDAVFDYKEAGMDDDKLIKRALKVEKNNGEIGGAHHKEIMDVAGFTKDYGKEYIEDEKKRATLEGIVKQSVSGVNNQKKVMETFAELHGGNEMKKFYKENSQLYKTQEPKKAKGRPPKKTPQRPKQTINQPEKNKPKVQSNKPPRTVK